MLRYTAAVSFVFAANPWMGLENHYSSAADEH